jgi:hypothetical protein
MYNPCWACAEQILPHTEHTRNEFHCMLSIRGTDFIACWACAEMFKSRISQPNRIRFSKISCYRLLGPYGFGFCQKSIKKNSCLCTFKRWLNDSLVHEKKRHWLSLRLWRRVNWYFKVSLKKVNFREVSKFNSFFLTTTEEGPVYYTGGSHRFVIYQKWSKLGKHTSRTQWHRNKEKNIFFFLAVLRINNKMSNTLFIQNCEISVYVS